MYESTKAGYPVTLEKIDRFVDGAAVKRVGISHLKFVKTVLSEVHLVPGRKGLFNYSETYNEDAIVVEPAGALSIAALDDYGK